MEKILRHEVTRSDVYFSLSAPLQSPDQQQNIKMTVSAPALDFAKQNSFTGVQDPPFLWGRWSAWAPGSSPRASPHHVSCEDAGLSSEEEPEPSISLICTDPKVALVCLQVTGRPLGSLRLWKTKTEELRSSVPIQALKRLGLLFLYIKTATL